MPDENSHFPQAINVYISDYINKVKAQKLTFIQVILTLAIYLSSGISLSLTQA